MNAKLEHPQKSSYSKKGWLQTLHRVAAGTISMLLVFYFLLVAAALTPSPFEPDNAVHFVRYLAISVLMGYLAAFSFYGAKSPEKTTGRASKRSTTGFTAILVKNAAVIFAASWLLLLLIQLTNQWLGLPAPLSATNFLVVVGLVAVALLSGTLMAKADRPETAGDSDQSR